MGKWHLGDTPELLPTNQGFDEALFITKSNNQTKKLYRGDELVEDPFDNRLLTATFFAEAERFIETHRDRPFLLYVPLTVPHFPAEAHPSWKGRSELGAYGDVVEELDERMGRLLDRLDEWGIDERTIVVFLSDNGPEPNQRTWARSTPYRGMKWSSLEGANRVPCLVRFPGTIAGGRACHETTVAIDLLPTLTHACDVDLSRKTGQPKLDGVEVWSMLAGKSRVQHPRSELLFWDGWGVPQAIRVGDWKLYFDEIEEVPGSDEGPVLYDLGEDPAERTDVAGDHPDHVRTMLARARERLTDVATNPLPLGGPADRGETKTKRPK